MPWKRELMNWKIKQKKIPKIKQESESAAQWDLGFNPQHDDDNDDDDDNSNNNKAWRSKRMENKYKIVKDVKYGGNA